ncbi:MAG: tetratricopeptide repeat protein [Chloroflexi bacterium]|nr:tetratricopeptide repeat protein [Chloroflexota bacterium]
MNTNRAKARGVTLPTSPDVMVGRAREVSLIRDRLKNREIRLVTLCGVGGIGKTRLALEIARSVQTDFADGSRFVDLAAFREPPLVLSAILSCINARHTGRRLLLDALKRALQRRHLLLVLDNFEQVLQAAPLIAELLKDCPALTILATSRAPLRLSWEHEFPVGPLEIPDKELYRQPHELAACPSVALLLERMGRVGVADTQELDDLVALAEICRRLDGIPLAIELAAARARLLPPRAMLARLERPLNLLTAGPRDTPARHQTLRKTFDWSYDLLTDVDQKLFRQLGVFVGGCTIEAAARVSDGHSPVDVMFLDSLGRLVEASLLRREEQGPAREARLSMLEPIREYALERLQASGEADLVRQRHAIAYLELAELADPELRGARQTEWLARLERDHGNLRVAQRWFIERGDVERSLRMAAALSWFWWISGFIREGLERLKEVLAQQAPHPRGALVTLARANALCGAGVLAYQQGDLASSSAHMHAALALYEHSGDARGRGLVLNTLGNCALVQGDVSRAELLYEQSLEAHRAAGDVRGQAQTMTNMGLVAFQSKNYDRAHRLLIESLSMERALGDTHGVAFALGSLGLVQCYRGELVAAQASFRESLSLWRDAGGRAYLPLLLEAYAVALAAGGDGLRAVRVAGGAAALREEIDAPRPAVWTPELNRWLDMARAAIGREASTKAWNEGLALSVEEVIAEALAAERLTGPRVMPVSSSKASDEPKALPSGLTPREAEVLRMVASGDTNKEIAGKLVVSIATVERHLANIYGKIGARGRADATAFAITHSLHQPTRQ